MMIPLLRMLSQTGERIGFSNPEGFHDYVLQYSYYGC